MKLFLGGTGNSIVSRKRKHRMIIISQENLHRAIQHIEVYTEIEKQLASMKIAAGVRSKET